MIHAPTHCPDKQPLCPKCLAEVERRIRISRAQTQRRNAAMKHYILTAVIGLTLAAQPVWATHEDGSLFDNGRLMQELDARDQLFKPMPRNESFYAPPRQSPSWEYVPSNRPQPQYEAPRYEQPRYQPREEQGNWTTRGLNYGR